jgi:DNA modification methylase
MMPKLNHISCMDALEYLRQCESKSVNCIITSPPYWGLRDYGVSGQVGLEDTLQEFIGKLVNIFREARRVLRGDGTFWLNMGDGYAATSNRIDPHRKTSSGKLMPAQGRPSAKGCELQPKNLLGQPWRLAFALQDDGWYLRSDIIWSKPNPMPESVTDRPTKAHEYIFLLTKSARYWYDAEAIKEVGSKDSHGGGVVGDHRKDTKLGRWQTGLLLAKVSGYRNKRSVWTVATTPMKAAHFATFPEALIKPMVLAGCPKDGIVLDMFMGAGTTALVAQKHNRNFMGCELNPDYIEIANARLNGRVREYLNKQKQLPTTRFMFEGNE